MEHPFGQLSVAVPGLSPLKFLSTPSLLTGGQNGAKESLDAVQALLSNGQNTGVLAALF